MFFRILKKDMRVRKSVNLILFLFITIASVFLASSVSNIVVVSSAIDYYLDYANIPEVMLLATKNDEKDQICNWLEKEANGVKDSSYEEMIMLSRTDITYEKNNKAKEMDTGGADVLIGTIGNKYCKVYDMDGEEFSVKNGEIAFSKSLMESNGLKIGDKITLHVGEIEKVFTIKLNTKDAVFGSPMSGTLRMIISNEEYKELFQQENLTCFNLHYVETDDAGEFMKEVNAKNFLTITNTQTRSTFELLFVFDMIVAALLIFVGICLIIIAFLVLRFALVFTIEEDYREIGIMKAIGMRNFNIKKIYLVKYLFLVVTGAILGFGISIPVSEMMIKSVSQNMIMESSSSKIWINVLCTIFIVVVVLLFCYRCTAKLNKISAIAAIRGGQEGERYKKRAGFSLYKRKRLSVICFLGLNDIVSNIKRYLILLFTFCISFILITIPLNTLNTMRSREMVEKFDINPDSKIYLRNIEKAGEQYTSSSQVQEGIERVKEELKQAGYDTEMTFSPIYFIKCGNKGEKAKVGIMTIQVLGDNPDFLLYDEGDAPILENEIAFSKDVLELYDWKIGDTIEATVAGETKQMLITGTYTDYMQMGQSARLNSAINCENESMFDYWNIMVDFDTDLSQEEVKEELKKKFPKYEWSTAQEVVDASVGGIQQTMDSMLYPMTGMLCILIMLITMLMEKLFIVREKGEMAMLKSIGFKTRDIRMWQVIRMVFVAVISMIVAVPMSMLSNRFVLRPIFGIMGAELDVQVVAWKVYGAFPAVLLVGIIVAAIWATRSIKKISIQEMNRAE